MKIKSIRNIGNQPVYDITVEKSHEYILKNGVITHNTGIYYSADNIWIIGRQQDKEGDELVGWNYVINIEKSRYAREKTKIIINVNSETGINKWSGLLENAVEAGVLEKPLPGRYRYPGTEDKGWKEDEIIASDKFWKDCITKHPELKKYINEKYTPGSGQLVRNDEDYELDTSEYEDQEEDLGDIL